jgi:acetyltransferase-like isoleucine patch superfamily enzyme
MNFIEKLYRKYLLHQNLVTYAKYIGVKVGENCRIYTNEFGSEPFLISIGNNVTITAGVRFLNHDGAAWLMKDEKGRRYLYAPIKIGNNVFIGINSIIMPGVVIDDDVIVAAGSVLTKSVSKGNVVAGNPAKIIGSYYDLKNKILKEYVSEKDIDKHKQYREQILLVMTKKQKPYL